MRPALVARDPAVARSKIAPDTHAHTPDAASPRRGEPLLVSPSPAAIAEWPPYASDTVSNPPVISERLLDQAQEEGGRRVH